MIDFWVPGDPAPAGSKTGFSPKGSTRVIIRDACKRTKPWQCWVKECAVKAYQGPLLTEAVHLQLIFTMPRPASQHKSGDRSKPLKPTADLDRTKKPDLTKLTRAVEDACTGVVWADDAQVVRTEGWKFYETSGHPRGVLVVIKQLGPFVNPEPEGRDYDEMYSGVIRKAKERAVGRVS